MRTLSFIFLFSFFFLLFSCEKDDNDNNVNQDNNDTVLANNSAILAGDPVGDHSEDKNLLWKTGEIIMDNSPGLFEVDELFIGRTSSSSSYIYWIIPIKNTSSNHYAFVEATGIKILDSQNKVIYEDNFFNYTFVEGSCGNPENSTSLTNTFLKAGETGYFLGIDQVDFSRVAKIRLSSIDYSETPYFPSEIKAIPLSYSVSGQNVEVMVENQGNQTLYISTSPYILMDQNNAPLTWTYLDPDASSSVEEEVIAAKGMGEMVDESWYKGSGSKIRVILDVDLESSAKSISLKSSETNIHKHYRNLRKERDRRLRQIEN